jgi:hypothetical protein
VYNFKFYYYLKRFPLSLDGRGEDEGENFYDFSAPLTLTLSLKGREVIYVRNYAIVQLYQHF